MQFSILHAKLMIIGEGRLENLLNDINQDLLNTKTLQDNAIRIMQDLSHLQKIITNEFKEFKTNSETLNNSISFELFNIKDKYGLLNW